MAATLVIEQSSGAVYSGSQKSAAKAIFNFLSLDDCTASILTGPLLRPDVGTNFSFEIWLRVRCDVAPDNFCNNFMTWLDSVLPSGYKITVNSSLISTYQSPIDFQSDAGTRVDFSDYPNDMTPLSLVGEVNNIGDYSSWLVFQLELDPTVETGNFLGIDFTLQYDEG